MPTTASESHAAVVSQRIPSTALFRYQSNVTTLRAHQPDVALELERLSIPADVVFAKGRDGSSTWQFTDKGVPTRWLGGTSMPTVSAPILVEGFQDTGGNVWLAGPMSGIEYSLLAARTPSHTAIFTLSDDLLSFKLAMHLYDYSQLFKAGRLVVMSLNSLESKLVDFIAANPGYELPQKLLFAPQVSETDRLEIQRTVELASERALSVQQSRVREYAKDLSNRPAREMPTRPKVALLSLDARAHAVEHAERLRSAFSKLDLQHSECIPVTPAQCHLAARLRAMHDLDAELVVFINNGASGLRNWLSPSLPVVTWNVHESEIEPPSLNTADSAFCVVDSTTSRAHAVEADWPTNRVMICEPSTDDTMFKRIRISPADQAKWQCDVAIFADLVDPRPIAAGITLPSHIELWNEITRLARNQACKSTSISIDSLIANAETRTGVKLTDTSLRKQWINLVEHRALSSARLFALAEAIADECQNPSVSLGIFGQGWHLDANLHPLHRGPMPDLHARNVIYNLAKVVVLPNIESCSVQQAIDALAVGCQVILNGLAEEFKSNYPGLTDLVPFLRFFAVTKDLAAFVSDSIKTSSNETESRPAADLIRRKHATAIRLQWMIEQVRFNLSRT